MIVADHSLFTPLSCRCYSLYLSITVIGQECTNRLQKHRHGLCGAPSGLVVGGPPHKHCNREESSYMAPTLTHPRTPLCWGYRTMASPKKKLVVADAIWISQKHVKGMVGVSCPNT
jgi:hypothetical protein